MILQALTNYYEKLSEKDGMSISKPGWSKVGVSFALNISKNGELLNILPLKIPQEQKGKIVNVPQELDVPEHFKRSGTKAPSYFLCDNIQYVLGLEINKKVVQFTEKAGRSHKEFLEYQEKLLENSNCEKAMSLIKFLREWKICEAVNNDKLNKYFQEMSNSDNVVFMIDGGEYIQNDKNIMEIWDLYYSKNSSDIVGQCLVTGNYGPISRLHPAIKGINGAQAMGVSLVSFNDPADDSYGHDSDRGLNAPVSEYATFAYGTALNKLLSDKKHKQSIGDMTIVYWSETGIKEYADLMSGGMFDEDGVISDNELNKGFENISNGNQIVINNIVIDPTSQFYVLGLTPNVARLSVRFFWKNMFGNVVENIKKHNERMKIIKPNYETKINLPLWMMLQETTNSKSKVKVVSSLLGAAILRAILNDCRYPESLFKNILLRIRAEQGKNKINRIKAAIIKACLIKNYNFTEVATVAVNEESKNLPYVLGRLFSVLEAIQEAANPSINSTIKDRYFNSACATPASIFAILLKLTNHHLRKLSNGASVYYEKQIGELSNKIEMRAYPLPMHLNLQEQGAFILGYYHQTQKRYEKKEEK